MGTRSGQNSSAPEVDVDAELAQVGFNRIPVGLYARIAGLFMLLFAHPLARIDRMRADQAIVQPDGTVTIRCDTIARTPGPTDPPTLTAGSPASYANQGRWLFPGRLPGKPLITKNVCGHLIARGI